MWSSSTPSLATTTLSKFPTLFGVFPISNKWLCRFFILERCKASLKDLFEKPEKYKGQIKLPFNHDIMFQLAKGLEFIHSQKIVHRDIKPANVLISVDDQSHQVTMKWTDFGLSKTVNERETFSISGVKGTMDWFAPEVFASEANQDSENKMRGTTKSDVFSEGCVFGYLLLDGQHPFGSSIDAENEIQSNILIENFVNLKRELKS
jgi:serine/threonine-protein kinase/endoribonuclease IRE1